VVPVNLTVLAGGPFFDNLPGGLSFSFKTNGTATSQIVQIGNGGPDIELDRHPQHRRWRRLLTATPASGTAASIATISVTAAISRAAGARRNVHRSAGFPDGQ